MSDFPRPPPRVSQTFFIDAPFLFSYWQQFVMTMNIRKWIKCRWIILFAWYNRSYCFRRKALRHLISFTTLNKFYDPSIKKNCKEHCVWTVLICFDHKSDHSTTPLTDGRCKNIFTALGFACVSGCEDLNHYALLPWQFKILRLVFFVAVVCFDCSRRE